MNALVAAPAPGAATPIGFLTTTRLMLVRKLRETLRQPAWLVSGLVTPLLYLALFAPLLDAFSGGLSGVPGFGGGDVVDGFLPGMLVLFAFGSGTGTGWTVIAELDAGVIERFRVTPIARSAILLGGVLKDCLMFLVPALLVVAIATPFGFDVHPGGLAATLGLLVLLTGAVSAACAALGLTLKAIGSLAAVVTGLQLPLTLLSGVLLPMSLGPGWLRALAHVNPLFYATEAARELCQGEFTRTGALGFGVIGLALAVSLAWATRVYRRAVA
jgi:ABC-2 type transport system permease protein